jgi:hypothetical protein
MCGSLLSLRYNSAARRLTFMPPGSMPSLRQPFLTQVCITFQIPSKPSRMSASLRQAFSFSSITSLMRRL